MRVRLMQLGCVAGAALCLLAGSVRAGVVELRSTVRAVEGAPIALRDVARLDGVEAERLGNVVLVDMETLSAAPKEWIEVRLVDVRARLTAAGANWALLELRGGKCSVHVLADSAVQNVRERSENASTRRAYDKPALVVVDANGGTVRALVASKLASHFNVPVDRVRLSFSQSDTQFLENLVDGQRVEVAPAASSMSARVPVRVRMYQGEILIHDRMIRIEAEVQRDVLVTQGRLRKGDVVSAGMVVSEQRWVAPGVVSFAEATEIFGRTVRSRVNVGVVVEPRHLVTPVAIERGELATVRCLSGGIALTAKARALSDGQVGELIEMRLEGAEKTFMARVTGPGGAVMDLDERAGAPGERAQRNTEDKESGA